MTVHIEDLNLRIRFRFIGNYEIGSDDQGIETLLYPQFQVCHCAHMTLLT